MIRIEKEPESNLIKTLAQGKLHTDDYRQLRPILEETLKQHKKLRWFFEMQDFEGWTPGAAWEDLKFDVAHAADMEKIAMVGKKSWENWLSQLMRPFTTAEIRFFEEKDREQAMSWIKR